MKGIFYLLILAALGYLAYDNYFEEFFDKKYQSAITQQERPDYLGTLKGGDGLDGNGFLLMNKVGAFLLFDEHFLNEAVSELKAQTLGGEPLVLDRLWISANRGVIMAFQPNRKTGLELMDLQNGEIGIGDEAAIVTFKRPGGAALRFTGATVESIGPEGVELSSLKGLKISKGGAPVIHLKTRKVIGIISSEPGRSVSKRSHLAHRLDNVQDALATTYRDYREGGQSVTRFIERTALLRELATVVGVGVPLTEPRYLSSDSQISNPIKHWNSFATMTTRISSAQRNAEEMRLVNALIGACRSDLASISSRATPQSVQRRAKEAQIEREEVTQQLYTRRTRLQGFGR